MAKKVFEVSLSPIFALLAMGISLVDTITFDSSPGVALGFGQLGVGVVGSIGAIGFAMATAIALDVGAILWDIGG